MRRFEEDEVDVREGQVQVTARRLPSADLTGGICAWRVINVHPPYPFLDLGWPFILKPIKTLPPGCLFFRLFLIRNFYPIMVMIHQI